MNVWLKIQVSGFLENVGFILIIMYIVFLVPRHYRTANLKTLCNFPFSWMIFNKIS